MPQPAATPLRVANTDRVTPAAAAAAATSGIGHMAADGAAEAGQPPLVHPGQHHVGVAEDSLTAPQGRDTGSNRSRGEDGGGEKIEIGGGMDDAPHHRPLGRAETVLSRLAVDDREAARLDLRRVNDITPAGHCKSPPVAQPAAAKASPIRSQATSPSFA